MSFWAGVVGGVLGGFVGGPVGAGVGAGLGISLATMLDSTLGRSTDTPKPPTLPMRVQWDDDDDGRLLIIQPGFPVDIVTGFVIRTYDAQSRQITKGHEPYCDGDGDFFAFATLSRQHNIALIYIPQGAFISSGPVVTTIYTFADDKILGESDFEIGWPMGPFLRPRIFRPIIGLAMRVARADGQLERSEVRTIREFFTAEFELSPNEQAELQTLMKTEPSASIETQVQETLRRFQIDDIFEITIEFLARVAHANDHIHETEVQTIREIALEFGLDPDDWDEIATNLGLFSIDQLIAGLLLAFDLAPGATLHDVKTAYRAKMRDYHPDKVAHLPKEFQQVAHTKSQELNESFERLKILLSES